MEVNVGDKFKVKIGRVITMTSYTVIDIIGNSVKWDCIGKKHFYKTVSIATIQSWIQEGRLIKIDKVK